MTDAPKTIEGERIDYTAEQLKAMGEAYAAAYADAKAKQDADDAEMVERVAEHPAFFRSLRAYCDAKERGDEDALPEFRRLVARAALSAMRGEP